MGSSCCNSSGSGSCDKKIFVWECLGCGYRDPEINKNIPLNKCPECGMGGDYFVQVAADSIPNLCF